MQTVNIKELLTVSFTLFAIIDIIGSIPILISLKGKMGGIREFRATMISGALMILFLFTGEPFFKPVGFRCRFFFRGRFNCDFYSWVGDGIRPGIF